MNNRYRLATLLIVGVVALLPEALAQSKLTPMQRRLMSGFVSHELDQHEAALRAAAGVNAGRAATSAAASDPTAYQPTSDDGCEQKLGSNVKVNQNCLNITDPNLQGRAQAQNETAIAEDPFHPGHLVAGFNDYRRGDGTCGWAFSLDDGGNWTDGVAPNSFTRGTGFGGVAREYWQAGGDTSVAWDTRGNAYLICQTFMRGAGVSNNPDQSSAVYVFRATQNKGASWNFPGRPVIEDFDTTGATLQDKPYGTVDNHVASPFRDRIYVTWTNFAADGTAYIYESHSADYGETFSAPVAASLDSSLCTNTFSLPTPLGHCNSNQDSQPFTGPDGTLYVVFNNYNNTVTGSDNRNQLLLVKSTDGGATFSAPVKVADIFDLPDCLTYQGQDAGRACVPEKGSTANSIFRANNYPSGAVNPHNSKEIVIAFGSYINRNSQETSGCSPNGVNATTGANLYNGVKGSGGCANQILVSISTNGGATFTGGSADPRTLPVISKQNQKADAFWQWAGFTWSGVFAVSYYDRSYGTDNVTGSMDVSAAWWDGTDVDTRRATSSSMPPPTQFSGLFFGDYAGLAVGSELHPIWMDTRNSDLFVCPGTAVPGVPPQVCTATEPNGVQANDQEIFTTRIVPDMN